MRIAVGTPDDAGNRCPLTFMHDELETLVHIPSVSILRRASFLATLAKSGSLRSQGVQPR